MNLADITKYLRSMSFSFVMMLLLAYGMATSNPLLQPLYIIIGMLILQFGYQIVKSARSRGAVDANMRDAARVRRGTILFEATEVEVNKAKGKSGDGTAMGTNMLIALIAPLAIFIGAGYVLNQMSEAALIPRIEPWLSYLIAAFLSMPISVMMTVKMGAAPGAMAAVTPKSYVVCEKGIAFDHLGQSFILRFPLTKLNVQKEKNLIEAEGKPEASVIPSRLKLFCDRIDNLDRILTKNVQDSS